MFKKLLLAAVVVMGWILFAATPLTTHGNRIELTHLLPPGGDHPGGVNHILKQAATISGTPLGEVRQWYFDGQVIITLVNLIPCDKYEVELIPIGIDVDVIVCF